MSQIQQITLTHLLNLSNHEKREVFFNALDESEIQKQMKTFFIGPHQTAFTGAE
jgi:hypothetical protein